MFKKFFITLFALITLFMSQSPVWSAVSHSAQTSEELNLQIDKSTFLVSDDSPAIIAKRDKGSASNHSNSALWIANFFVIGLAQIIMGDAWRGIKFYLFIVMAIVVLVFSRFTGYLLILLVRIWDIVDAYNMSQEDNDKDSMTNDQRLAKMNKLYEEKLSKLNDLIKVSGNGMVSVNAFSF